MSSEGTRWGWHQLRRRWASRIVLDADIHPGDLVLDVGAGEGALIGPLLGRGALVVAIELNPRRAERLRETFAGRPVTVVVADAGDLRLPRRPFKVVANPPFTTSTALLRRLVAPGSRLTRADIVVPWHASRRWASDVAPGAGRWRAEFTVRTGRPLPRSAFSPPAPNGVALIVIERRVSKG